MAEPVTINAEIDIETLKTVIEKASDLNDNEELFGALAEIQRVKNQVSVIFDQLKSIEEEAKGLINSKATALYGNNWEALKGSGYKITKSPTGSVFALDPDARVMKKFKVVKESPDSKLIEAYVKERGKLPTGIDYNPDRGFSIKISVKDDE